MKRFAITLVGLLAAAGCSPAGPEQVAGGPAAQPYAAAPETTLTDVALNPGSRIEALAPDVARRIADELGARAAEAKVPGAAVAIALSTVGDLRKAGQFSHSYLSDDTQVAVGSARGHFEAVDPSGQGAPEQTYTRMLGIFDPLTGETLGFGLMP